MCNTASNAPPANQSGEATKSDINEPGGDQQLTLDFDVVEPSPQQYSKEFAERGDKNSQFQLAQGYEFGVLGLPRDPVQALVWYKAAACNGHPRATMAADRITEALSGLDRLADAQYLIGSMFQDSTRVRTNRSEAVKWFRKAASRGQSDAQMELGKFYEGLDRIVAFVWYRVSDKQGCAKAKAGWKAIRGRMSHSEFADACAKLGEMYLSGTVIPQNWNEALFWYREAARKGVASAELALGEIYRNGEGVTVNEQVAFKNLLNAAKQGLGDAQRQVGEMYLKGEGVRSDPVEGLAWMHIALLSGSRDTKARIHDAEGTMTSSDVSKAKARRDSLARQIGSQQRRRGQRDGVHPA